MKKIIAGALFICLLTVLSGCSDWSNNSDDGNKVMEQLREWTGTLGRKQITKDSDLYGERTLEQEGDYYSGSYNAQTEQVTGRDVVFGGAGMEERTIICSGNIKRETWNDIWPNENVEHYAEEALAIEPANEDAYYWLIRVLKMRNSNVMAKGQLHMAKHVLDEKEYERLEKRLSEMND